VERSESDQPRVTDDVGIHTYDLSLNDWSVNIKEKLNKRQRILKRQSHMYIN
jgi:hypothetical protein